MNAASMAQAVPAPVLQPIPVSVGTAQIIQFKLPKPVAAAARPVEPRPGPLAPPLAIIRRPARCVKQHGQRDPGWVLEFEPAERALPDPLMGWVGSRDIYNQLRIPFPNRESAERFALRRGLPYVVVAPAHPAWRPRYPNGAAGDLDAGRQLSI